tara:strand:- start:3746 stop:4069 length:324 start_codon:yes stop_codon:yes gene_type:complete
LTRPKIDPEERAAELTARQQKGGEAEELLAHPLITGVFERIDKELVESWNLDSLDVSRAYDVYLTNGLWIRLKDAFETLVRQGHDAEIELLNLDKREQKQAKSAQYE